MPAVWLALILLTLETAAWGQSFDRQKAGVVRVTSQVEGLRRTGTGFIVGLDSDAAYIVTASHVVEGDSQPRVEFFTKRNATVQAETARIEGGDPRGLALLIVRGKDNLPPGLVALPIAQGSDLNGGEPVTVIGFPQGGGSWAVLRANIASREGRDLTLDGSIAEGNSGGPVLMGESVIGVITQVGGAGKFGRAVPAPLVRLVLDGWGVRYGRADRRSRCDHLKYFPIPARGAYRSGRRAAGRLQGALPGGRSSSRGRSRPLAAPATSRTRWSVVTA